MKNKYLIILVAIMLLGYGCKKDSAPQEFTENSYPLAIGDWWKYLTYSSGSISDTFILRVDSMTTFGPYTKYICNYVGNGTTVAAGYFLQSDTSLSFINPSAYAYYAYIGNFHLRFPATTGQYWAGSFYGDSIMVDNVIASQSYYGHIYSPCYYLKESYDLPHNYKVENMVLTPKVGLIYQSINFNSDTAGRTASYSGGVQIQQSIDLISCHIQ